MYFTIRSLDLTSAEKKSLRQFLRVKVEMSRGSKYNTTDAIYALHTHAKISIKINDRRRVALNRFIAVISNATPVEPPVVTTLVHLSAKEKIDLYFKGEL